MASTDRATGLRMRAAEARRSAEVTEDDACRRTLIALAETYERIAERKQRVDRHAAMIEVQHRLEPLTSMLR
jgi:hypothetical protein